MWQKCAFETHYRALAPDEGTITIDGEDLGGMSEGHLYRVRQKFGVLFQGSALFDSMTVEENIALALKGT